ncbi:MAG TPA: nucleoside deaminase [Clostridiales bacterium]|jgi:guanine deaminase|nr:nucleoside deaminase [Clostridia bacterium]HCF65832.1 nucleoside deaminase [Clostridiales bacterium]
MNKYMKIADELAQQNILTNDGGPFGAVIIKNNEIVGKGNNQVVLKNDPTAHAEIVAIRDACKNLGTFDLTGCEIYTSCYPCPMCLSAIIWSNIKMVYYGNTKEDAEKIGFRDNLIYEYLEGQSKTSNKEDILKIIAMDREETIKTFESYQNKSENKTMY